MVLLLTACAAQVQKSPPVQQFESKVSADNFYAADGVYLPLRRWLPPKKPKAVVLGLHGFNDYSYAFNSTGEYFAKHGVALYAYDQRGFGASNWRGIWAGEKNYVSDVKQAVRQLAATHPKTPIYLLGESMGGAIAVLAMNEPDAPKVKGVILAAPALWGRDTMSPLYRATLWFMMGVSPGSTFTGANLKILASSNIPMLKRMGHDPNIIKATRVDALDGLVDLMDNATSAVPKFNVPTLYLYGANDQVIRPAATEAALKRFHQPITYVYYPLGYHMLLRDLQAQVVHDDILSWIKAPNKALPSGLAEVKQPQND